MATEVFRVTLDYIRGAGGIDSTKFPLSRIGFVSVVLDADPSGAFKDVTISGLPDTALVFHSRGSIVGDRGDIFITGPSGGTFTVHSTSPSDASQINCLWLIPA